MRKPVFGVFDWIRKQAVQLQKIVEILDLGIEI